MMAEEGLSGRAFLDSLSANDRAVMTDLVEEFFCSSLDEEEEQGMHQYSRAKMSYRLPAMTRFGEW